MRVIRVAALAAVMLRGGAAAAQERVPVDTLRSASSDSVDSVLPGGHTPASGVFVGSELDGYLRSLQTVGIVPEYPWTVRDWSPREADRLMRLGGKHPWEGRPQFGAPPVSGLSIDILPLTTRVEFNSAFPYGYNDGPIWAGRGFTTALQGGVAMRWKVLSLTLAPVAFSAQNRPFTMIPNGQTGAQQYADGTFPGNIDHPQRFGADAYTVLDPGESTLRIDYRGIAAGISTADQWWGPAATWPIILGDNAAGFPHAFVGTSHPVGVGIGKIHLRVEWGRLAQSPYSPVTGTDYYVSGTESGRLRFMSGIVGTYQPRWVPGLEIGGDRFFHMAYPRSGVSGADYLKPFEGFLAKHFVGAGRPSLGADNQLASIFFRWVLPHSGFELYGEYGREDHNYDLRDLMEEPDHTAGHMVGVRHTILGADSSRMVVLRGELIDLQASTLERHRGGQGSFYLHSTLRQGHTYLGQVLGAGGIGVGNGAGTTLAVDWYRPDGRWTVSASQMLQHDWGTYDVSDVATPGSEDVQYTLGVERFRSAGRVTWTTGVTMVGEFNRYAIHHATNLNAVTTLAWLFR